MHHVTRLSDLEFMEKNEKESKFEVILIIYPNFKNKKSNSLRSSSFGVEPGLNKVNRKNNNNKNNTK